ncbi:transcriptional regulator [Limnohabitans sp. Rim8]|nr:metalloregulator ArsR/SmtB family transcription factor [Limnohabitans sp. Rim8]PUE61398.1 transcriptional regulator [Limnohabitans sp. Rim8]
MLDTQVVEALAALAQGQRLRAFRALVVAGKEGLTPSALAALLQIAPSALSFHLKNLSHAGLVSAEASGRNLIYRAEFARMNNLLTYLTQDCCQGQSCAVVPETSKTCC